MANVVAVEQYRCVSQPVEFLVKFIRDRALTASTQSCEPNNRSSLPESLLTLLAGDAMLVPDDVRCFGHQVLSKLVGKRELLTA